MAKDSGSLLPGRDDPVLPIADRKAPLLERIRNRRNRSGIDEIAKSVSDVALSEEGVDVDKLETEFRQSLASQLGVPEEAIKDDFVSDLSSLFDVDEEDIVNLSELESKENGDGDGSDNEDEDDETIFD